ncbi:MAG: hypothetical protein PHV68_03890 [Candidatus Gastranaerophilales bacterium]|nr:hypothetical protein [Candidatus Gastranaerophilales bacterium]
MNIQSNNTIIGASAATGVGAGVGAGAYKFAYGPGEKVGKATLEMTKDEFVQKRADDVAERLKNSKFNLPENLVDKAKKQADEVYDEVIKMTKDGLEVCKKTKIKYVALGAVAGLAIYTGAKHVIDKVNAEKN